MKGMPSSNKFEVVYPDRERVRCQFCDSQVGHEEEVWTGDMTEGKSGWELWFCCHTCRDAGEPCETFFALPILTK